MNDRRSTLYANLAVLAFGVLTLLFLIAIDRPQWFELRPVSGTARAMSLAAEQPDLTTTSGAVVAKR